MRHSWLLLVLPCTLTAHCGGMSSDSGTGSETNWVSGCTTSEDCATGECLCGICATPCDGEDACGETSLCAESGTPLHGSVCAESSPGRTSGLCLPRCSAQAPCAHAMRCEDGVCLPIPADERDGARIGAACVLEADRRADFAGHAVDEVTVEDRASDCESSICLAVNFEGRAGCPYGQSDPERPDCSTPDGEAVTVAVSPQLVRRPPADAVYCSCRCGGPDDGPFCACPRDFECRPVVDDLGQVSRALVGSYCVKAGTYVEDPSALGDTLCNGAIRDCEGR